MSYVFSITCASCAGSLSGDSDVKKCDYCGNYNKVSSDNKKTHVVHKNYSATKRDIILHTLACAIVPIYMYKLYFKK